jgi:hypothetical protein
MIGDFRIAVALAAQTAGIEFTWRRFPDNQPVRPDGFFSLQFPWLAEGGNRAFFFLEADRSTMPRDRFLTKLRAYHAWHGAGGHTRSLGIKSFRVLTVTKSAERMASLLAAAAGDVTLTGRRAAYWFTSGTGEGWAVQVLGPVWHTAAAPASTAALIPGVADPQSQT